ncbi:DDB1- and CUL4-associated factor 11-like [Corticium candelabrum]|uniref:DDB1- and CUL4-associated factor 11-like n=1 Tax=Corticium candelabrum TaxID=121492 RepID=UPI002E2718A7|nr:DDB1- and CUL4-associated factor 11-like [Corticium candelabrum]
MGNQSPESSSCAGDNEDELASLRALGEHDELSAALLAYLVHSGRVKLVPASTSNSESLIGQEGNDDKVEAWSDLPLAVKNNDISQLIAHASRLHIHNRPQPTARNLACNVKSRQVASSDCQGGFSSATKIGIMSQQRYLPNSSRVVARFVGKVTGGVFSSDGLAFMSMCQDNYIRLFDVTHHRFKCFHAVECRHVGYSVIDTHFSPDNSCLIYASWHDSIQLYRIYSDDKQHIALSLRPPNVSHFCPFSIRFSPDNNHILAGGNDGCVYLYDQARGERTLRFLTSYGGDDGVSYDVNVVSYADESPNVVFSGGDDTLCMVWDLRIVNESHPRPVAAMAGHRGGITFIDSKGDSRYLITNSKDQTIKLWDIRHPSDTETLRNARVSVTAAANWDYRWQAPPTLFDKQAEMAGDDSLMTYRGHQVLKCLIRSRFSPVHVTGQRYIYSGCSSGNVIVYDVLTGEVVSQLRGHTSTVRDASWHPYEQVICSSSWDGTHAWWEYVPERRDAVYNMARKSGTAN